MPLYEVVWEDADFDAGGNLIGPLDYVLIMNPAFNAFMTNLGVLLALL